MSYWIFGSLCFAAGGTFIWFFKIKIEKLVIGANALSKKLHEKADMLLK